MKIRIALAAKATPVTPAMMDKYLKFMNKMVLADQLPIKEIYDRGHPYDEDVEEAGFSGDEAEAILRLSAAKVEQAFKAKYKISSTDLMKKTIKSDVAKLPAAVNAVLSFINKRTQWNVTPHDMRSDSDGYQWYVKSPGKIVVSHWDAAPRAFSEEILKNIGAKVTLPDILKFFKYFKLPANKRPKNARRHVDTWYD